MVACPPGDKRGVQASLTCGYGKGVERLRLRCCDRRCAFRSVSIADDEDPKDAGEEIDADDKDTEFAKMIEQMGMVEAEEEATAQDKEQEEEAVERTIDDILQDKSQVTLSVF